MATDVTTASASLRLPYPMLKRVPQPVDADIRAAFEAEVLPHANRLFRLALWLERNRSDAEDVVQETMVRALRSFHRFEPGSNCRAWLITILHRVVSNRRRSKARSIIVNDPGEWAADTVPCERPIPAELTDQDVIGALRRLPQHYQEIVVLCDVEGLSYKETAEALAIPVGTVMSRLHRGRAQLRTELAAAGLIMSGSSREP